ncbi:MAG: hypothetical protein JXE06_02505 [Coriobacteriia bacterium]|nr:hypothetical protein [Coriobacteriia bacterium]MBN2822720.1 hypothetical protein [Coriobacteriia bacterium]
MAFFLVDRDRTDASIRLLATRAFSTREEALAALPGLISTQDSDSRDVFVCDLDTATPVLFVARPVSIPPSDEPSPDEPSDDPVTEDSADETPEAPSEAPSETEDFDAGLIEPEEMETESIVLEESAPAGVGLADALRRATNSLESEGIVAPESIPALVVPEPPAEDAPTELSAAIASLGIQVPEPEVEPEVDEDADHAATTEWPWANVAQVDEEEAPEAETIIEAEDDGPEEIELEDEIVEQSPPEVSPVVEPAAAEVAPKAYEPGEIQLDAYTCDDCVYANTCPKAGASNPAECGSFQWKSV